MPPNPSNPPRPLKTLDEVVAELGLYPRAAFEFVSRGLTYTVEKIHGPVKASGKTDPDPDSESPPATRHISGRQLCEGLREFALAQWGLLARTVLRRWNLTRTEDFGRIVFALVENGIWMKTDDDTLEDFKNVFEFSAAFDAGFRIESPRT